jgi:rhamnosyl/mannosyltransferase
MVYGKPVINTALPSGVPYVSLDGKTGLTVKPKSPKALAEAINRLAGDSELREKLGKAAAVRVTEEFSEESIQKRLYDILSE